MHLLLFLKLKEDEKSGKAVLRTHTSSVQIRYMTEKIEELKKEQEKQAFDSSKLLEISKALQEAEAELATREEEWLEVTLALEP